MQFAAMQLLIIQDYFRGGGTERQSVYVANMLHEHGCSVGCMTFRPGGIQRASLQLPDDAVDTLQPFDSRLNTWSPGLVSRIRAWRPQAVLLMGYAANEKGVCIKRALPEVRLIASMRTGKTLSKSYRQSLAVADHVVVNARWGYDLLVRQGWVQAERIFQINNPLTRAWDVAKRDEWRAAERRRRGIGEDTCVLLNVAGFRENKGQDELIRMLSSWSTCQPWKLWLVGDGPKLKRCRRQAQQLQLEDRIEFLGYQANPGAIMAAADIMLTASRRDAQPNALIEAQAVGLPIVAFDYAGIGECFEDGKSGFLVPWGNTSQFLQKIQLLAEDPQLRLAQARYAMPWAQHKFSTQCVKQSYLDLIGVC